MNRLAYELSRATEQGALAARPYLGKHQKNQSDGASVKAMRKALNQMEIAGRIVIGEGEIDEAPMLYSGERVGYGKEEIDLAVDPIDGTILLSNGRHNALCVLAATRRDGFLNIPEMYMEKLVVGQQAKGVIDLNLTFEKNLHKIREALDKPFEEMTLAILDRKRHETHIKTALSLGINVYTIDHGDISGGILTCIQSSDIDVLYGIGGGPEGILTAAAVYALGGDFQGRLVHYENVYPGDDQVDKRMAVEKKKCEEEGIIVGKVYTLEELIKSNDVIFCATGITKGDLVDGISKKSDYTTTETMVIDSSTCTMKRIETIHYQHQPLYQFKLSF